MYVYCIAPYTILYCIFIPILYLQYEKGGISSYIFVKAKTEEKHKNVNFSLTADKNKKEQTNTSANNWDVNKKIKQLDMALQTF